MAKQQRRGPSVSEKLESARANRYKVIHERNLLILALAKHGIGCSAHVVPTGTPEPKKGEWNHVLCLHTPVGQIHWKLSAEDTDDFRGYVTFNKKSDWDGARAPEKAERLERLHKLPRAEAAVDPVE
jgi:hypothetical protein